MVSDKKNDDYAFALKVCRRLRTGNRRAILSVHSRCHLRFQCFVRGKLGSFPPSKTDKVLNAFWLELMNGKAICAYKGKGPLSLCSFLLVNLNRRVLDEFRRMAQEKKSRVHPHPIAEDRGNDDENLIENRLMRKQCRRIVHTVLLQLEKEAPRDAALIRMYFLQEMTFKQMAAAELTEKNPDRKMLTQKENAIKKQLTRRRAGSLVKFKMLLSRHLRKLGICYTDLIS